MSVQNAPDEVALANRDLSALSVALWVRVAVLLVVGAVITFTATEHSYAAFTLPVMGVSLVLLGAATIGEYVVLRQTASSWLVALRAIATAVAGGVLFALLSSGLQGAVAAIAAATVVCVWAALCAAVSIARLFAGSQPRNVALPSAGLSVILALSMLVFRDDFVAIIGFFGAYAIVRAVFLGISVFDMKRPASQSPVATV